MTLEINLWPLTAWTYEDFHIISINQVWLKWDFNFSNEAIFTFSAYLTSWPQMTFDLGTWPLTAWTYEGSLIISINQVWLKSDFNFSNEAIFTFLAYLTTWPQMTFDLDIWPLRGHNNYGLGVWEKITVLEKTYFQMRSSFNIFSVPCYFLLNIGTQIIFDLLSFKLFKCISFYFPLTILGDFRTFFF